MSPDCLEKRLNNQHEVLIHVIDHKILHAPINPSSTTRIADVGTGTGVWLNGISVYLDATPTENGQTREYSGFDISASHFPPTYPSNFHYEIQDILKPFPEALRGKYDLVHVRLLVAALPQGSMKTVVENLTSLLSPGGWMQWDELDSETWGGRVPSSHVKQMYEVIQKYLVHKNMERHIPAAFYEAAKSNPELQNVSVEAFNTLKQGSDFRDRLNAACLWSYAKAAKLVMQGSGVADVEDKAESLRAGAVSDLENNEIYWDSDLWVLLAQRK
ncbi:hypothetical protein BP6252_13646 [Coleophoma cylindrospora]|uniref:Methyltransferase domain-containing protein n=1 Tax=Coleophoma cylindrospora TaxID=1849047 RepID=A0A3D8Q8S1_9HELO|nr:hypothetical protein BP6252_13646 [Coleophoma cylindrospora]